MTPAELQALQELLDRMMTAIEEPHRARCGAGRVEVNWRRMTYEELRADLRERFAEKRSQVFIEVAAMLDKLEADQLQALDALEQREHDGHATN